MSLPEYRIAPWRGSLAVVFYDEEGNRQRRALGTDDPYKAPTVARQIVEAIYAAKKPVAKTVGQHVDLYLEWLKGEEAVSYKTMVSHWNQAKPTFEKLYANDITVALCKSYAGSRARSGSTIVKELNIVSSALKRGKVRHEAEMWFPNVNGPRDVRMTREQITKLFNACEFFHTLVFCIVGRYTAARHKAILELEWNQCDFENRIIYLDKNAVPGTKKIVSITKKKRRKGRGTLKMHPNLAWALAIAKSVAQTPYVVEYAGRRLTTMKKGFNAAVARAKLPRNITPHVLRHTAATFMAEGGTSMEEIAQILGHKDTKLVYQVYARFSPDFQSKSQAALA